MQAPTRRIYHAEALAWMRGHPAQPRTSVVTSLPDVSELPELGFDRWRAWFIEASRQVLRWVGPHGVAIFYQSDIRHAGVWVDKGYLVMRAAEEEGKSLLWHKVVCRHAPGTFVFGRPSFSHMLCFSERPSEKALKRGADVLPDAGEMPWSKAMGLEACRVACKYLRDETDALTVVDPFCGRGTVLAVANDMGFAAVGVELSAKRCRAARALVVDSL